MTEGVAPPGGNVSGGTEGGGCAARRQRQRRQCRRGCAPAGNVNDGKDGGGARRQATSTTAMTEGVRAGLPRAATRASTSGRPVFPGHPRARNRQVAWGETPPEHAFRPKLPSTTSISLSATPPHGRSAFPERARDRPPFADPSFTAAVDVPPPPRQRRSCSAAAAQTPG